MNKPHSFGGKWTIEKLKILSDYLDFYITALKNQPFRKIYIDAFAGTGEIAVGSTIENIDGSAKLALNAVHKFNDYIFIEKHKGRFAELKTMISKDYSELAGQIQLINDDCNDALQDICKNTDWKNNRAVLFLDPYATELKWTTLEIIARTKVIDIWYLFPLHAAIRMLKNDGKIDQAWKNKLNSIFGDDGWEKEFYKPNPQKDLFGDDEDSFIKDADIKSIKQYIYLRLKSIFPAVSENSRILYNSKNSPLFLFCFAVSNENPKAIGLAIKVADQILKKEVSK
jgi:three-Cys-motif partner protein